MNTRAQKPQRIWVFHAGALGDHVLIWPLLRALVTTGNEVTLCCEASKAALASRCVGVRSLSAENREVTRLWIPGNITESSATHCADRVLSFLFADDEAESQAWCENVRVWLGAETIIHAGPPGSSSRAALWSRFEVERLGGVTNSPSHDGPVMCHVGAGSSAKRWPMSAWAALVGRLRAKGETVNVIAGEVERERFTSDDRRVFADLAGRVIDDVHALASMIQPTRLFIGADTGPTHLAAQLGVPTLALFGATDPSIWSPVGPRVRVLAPATPKAMSWLCVEDVENAASGMLATHGKDSGDAAM